MKRFKKVYIEISNVCNLQCSFCPEVIRDKKFMEPELFRKVITAVAPLTEEVCFHLMGEPLLHPEFEPYVEFCHLSKVPINLTTNGILLKEDRYKTLLNPTIKQINFSLQSFESNFPEKDNSNYLQNIFNFTEQALEKRPDLYINYRLWNHGAPGFQDSNMKTIEKIKNGLKINFENEINIKWKKNVKIKGRVYLHFDSRFEWPNPHHPVRSTKGFCHGLSSHIGILADGTVVPCCLDKEGVINLGNCGSQNILDLIQSPRAQSIHEGFQKGILIDDLCQKCTFIARFDNKAKHLKLEKAEH
ncbi:MAG: radical SAM/SPASM domain-containing protein [Elusimicrobiota bacterium]